MGKNCVLATNLMVRDYFCGTTELNLAKMTVVHIANLRPPKHGFQVKFHTQKHGTHTPVYKHGKYPPGFQSEISI